MKKELLLVAIGISFISGCQTEQERKKEVDQRLKELKATPKTNDIPIMAMCYDIAIKPARIEKVDPGTGMKTLSVKRG
jgi:PBP1b-binding outer membrane lipoprotein LpoB